MFTRSFLRNGSISPRGMAKTFLLFVFCSLLFTSISSAEELSLPFPSLIKEIQPTLLIYAPSGSSHKCFKITGGGSATTRDIVLVAGGHNAFDPPANRIIFLVHGYKDSENSEWLHILKNALVKERQQTVIIVGWGGGADLPDLHYKKALANIKTTAIWLGEIVKELRRMRPSLYIWGIGHSLGSHLLGLTGRSSPEVFNRITALDPSGALLETKNLDLRLRRTDAAFVDVIHADGCTSETHPDCWVAPNNHYGTLIPLGTIDFYPKYGQVPPTPNPLDVYRSHTRAVDLFTVSITHQGLFRTNETLDGSPGIVMQLVATQISETAEMGYWADTAFIPGSHDSRVNFYVNQKTMSMADRMIEHIQGMNANAKHHRTKRDIAENIPCENLPSNGVTRSISVATSTEMLLTGLIALWILNS